MLKKQITRVSPMQSAKVVAVMYLVVTIPFVVLFLIVALIGPRAHNPGTILLIAVPVIYALFGFFSTALIAAIYNFVAKRIGGIEFTTAEMPD
jgi:hypothetical protein